MCDLHFNRRTIQLRLITTPGEDHCLTADSINISQTLRVKTKSQTQGQRLFYVGQLNGFEHIST